MVRAGDIVADHFRRVAADKDGAGVVDAARKRVGIAGGDFEMLRREPVGERRRLVEALDQDHGAEIAPARARGRGPRQHGKLRLDRLLDRAGESLDRR